jgi:hypothetical protein
MALPAMRARARRGISPSTRSRGLRIFMTARVGRAGSDEQGATIVFGPTRLVQGPYPGSAGRRIAPPCNELHHRGIDECARHPSPCGHRRTSTV